jgi:hypothetical protein
MKHYKIEANPNISETCKTYIINNLSATDSSDEYSVYALDYVLETLADELSQNNGEDIFGISQKDLNEIENLLFKQKIDFIEFQYN